MVKMQMPSSRKTARNSIRRNIISCLRPAVKSTTSISDSNALILRILKAMETHDYRTLLIYTLDKETDYFGHKNSSSAFIQQDMTQDARSYKWCRFVPDLSTFQTSLGHDSIEYDSDALDVRGKEHKARCRLDIYYTPTTSPRLQALSLKVLPNHLQSGNSGSTVTGPASGQDDESGFKNAAAQCTEIIKTKIIPRYETKDGFTAKPLDINYSDDPAIAKWPFAKGGVQTVYDFAAKSDLSLRAKRRLVDRLKLYGCALYILLGAIFFMSWKVPPIVCLRKS